MNDAYRYKKIDAFTSGESLGNPAACFYLTPGQEISEEKMLRVAQQHKGFVSEVVYCTEEDGKIVLTFYSSECEVDFCGHGTIACMYAMIKDDPELMEKSEIVVTTNRRGPITVHNRIREQDAVFIGSLSPVRIMGTNLSANEVAAALGVPTEMIDTVFPMAVIDAGLRTLLIPTSDLESLVSMFPNEKTLKYFCKRNGLDIILAFSMETADAGCIAHTRVFAPKFGYLEDPATGSGNSAFGYYLIENGLWDGRDCTIEQGGKDRIYNKVFLSSVKGTVLFGGSATVKIDGTYFT